MFGTQKKEEIDSLARWNCKYHIVFAPKYRREAIYGQIRADIGSILRKLCEYKGRNYRGRDLPRPYPYAGEYPAPIQCITVYGISQREKFADDI